jgi:hypothetical protein
MEAGILAEEIPDFAALVGRAVVPDDNDRSAQVLEEITKELDDLDLRNVVEVEPVIESESFSGGTDGEAGDDGNAVMKLVARVDGGLAPRPPRSAHRGD